MIRSNLHNKSERNGPGDPDGVPQLFAHLFSQSGRALPFGTPGHDHLLRKAFASAKIFNDDIHKHDLSKLGRSTLLTF